MTESAHSWKGHAHTRNAPTPSHKAFLDTRQAADYLNLSPNTLHRWRWSGDGPRYRKFGRSVRYALDDLDAFAESGARENTAA